MRLVLPESSHLNMRKRCVYEAGVIVVDAQTQLLQFIPHRRKVVQGCEHLHAGAETSFMQ
jgi:hypothetical protein